MEWGALSTLEITSVSGSGQTGILAWLQSKDYGMKHQGGMGLRSGTNRVAMSIPGRSQEK